MSKYIPSTWHYGNYPSHIGVVPGFGTIPHIYKKGIDLLHEFHPMTILDILNYSGAGYEKVTLSSLSKILSDTLQVYNSIDILVGHSLGGAICLNTVLEYNTHIKHIVLINSLGIKMDPLHHIIWKNLKGNKNEIVKQIDTNNTKYFAQAYIRNPSYYMKTLDLCFKVDLSKKLSSLKIPTTIISSTKDALIPIKHTEKMHSLIRNSTLLSYNGYHDPMISSPQPFADFWKEKILPRLSNI